MEKGRLEPKHVQKSSSTPSSQGSVARASVNVSPTGQPMALRAADVNAMQKTGGNLAVQRMLTAQKEQTTDKTAGVDASQVAGKKFDDFDGKQYRVSGRAPNRKMEEVKRTEETTPDGSRKVVYYAVGEVVSFSGKMPIVNYYREPISLGDWYPSVTHLNGMNVAPQDGMEDAQGLQEAVNSSLDDANKAEGVALQQSAVDLLYTYSAKRSNFFLDLVDCIKGKVGVRDNVTEKQELIMLDAIRNKHRTTVSAHSRGTIKTDNAIRNVYKQLQKEYLGPARSSEEAKAAYEEALANASAKKKGASPEMIAEMARDEMAKQVAASTAEADMNKYIQLIFAGNAVSFPSKILKADLYVGNLDMVSFFVGTYTKFGAKMASQGNATLHKVSGGHGFGKNYSDHVGKNIAEDIRKR